MLHNLVLFNLHGDPIRTQWGVQHWVLVHVGYQYRLADGGLVVKPGASVTMATGPDVQATAQAGSSSREQSSSDYTAMKAPPKELPVTLHDLEAQTAMLTQF
jgi:hypothetical protein